jgi:hypothetical protein
MSLVTQEEDISDITNTQRYIHYMVKTFVKFLRFHKLQKRILTPKDGQNMTETCTMHY